MRQDVVSNIKVQINIKQTGIQEDVDPSVKWLERFLKADKETIPGFRVEYLPIIQNTPVPVSSVDTIISHKYLKHLRVCGVIYFL